MTHLELKRIRLDNNLKQSDIADLLDVKQSYVSDMEKGKKPISRSAEKIITEKYGAVSIVASEPLPEYSTSNIEKALKIISMQSESLSIKDEQINRLITLLENNMNK